ncbi:MAG: bifunctional methylenetetrahydrofolate dehydrogenase/methenyltetrahydrofolate cyclohydrolase FolD [Bacteroidota bacterium]
MLLDGKKVSQEILEEIKLAVDARKQAGKKVPHLAAVIVGNDGASKTYVESKIRACEKVGFISSHVKLDESISEQALLSEIEKLNNDASVDGFIIQLPLPKHINEQKIIEAVSPQKDVDGFHPINVGKLCLGMKTFVSATPFGIMQLLKRYKIETAGKNCVVIGRSNIVGSPMSILLSKNDYPGNCTVTLCHSKTQNLKDIVSKADIIVAALGKAEFLTADMVKQGAVVIDVGITRVSDNSAKGYTIKGDVKFDEVAPKCSYITPVPGGVGPMTIVSLMMNTLQAVEVSD